MVVVSVSYKPEEEDALLEQLDSLKGSFVFRVSGTIDQIASQIKMPCYRCEGSVNFSKRILPNDDIFMLYMLEKEDVTIESIPKMINAGFENIRAAKDVITMCESMRSMCLDCKTVANPIEDVQVLDHRSLSEKDESETPSSSKGSHILTEPVEHKKSEKKTTLENVPEQPNRKIPKIELLSARDNIEELQKNAFRSMLVVEHIKSLQDEAGHSPSTSAPPVNQDHHVEKEDSIHNISRAGDVKKELLEDSLQDLVDKPTSTAACASQDSGIEVMKFQAPVPVSVTMTLSSTVANIATGVDYEWQQAKCKKCHKPLSIQKRSGWKNSIKLSAMRHARMHMSIKAFSCEVCKWDCNYSPSKDIHMKTKHPLARNRFEDRRNLDSFIKESAKVWYECFDSDPQ